MRGSWEGGMREEMTKEEKCASEANRRERLVGKQAKETRGGKGERARKSSR